MTAPGNDFPESRAAKDNRVLGITINWEQWEHFNTKFLGSDGIVLFQFLFRHCSRLEPKHQGWFYHARADIERKTGVPDDRINSTIKKLVSAGIVEVKRKGQPATLHYRLRFDTLATDDSRLALIYLALEPGRKAEITGYFTELAAAQSGASMPAVAVPSAVPKTTKATPAKATRATPPATPAKKRVPELTEQQRQELSALREKAQKVAASLEGTYQQRLQMHNRRIAMSPTCRLRPLAPLTAIKSTAQVVTLVEQALQVFSPMEINKAAVAYFEALNLSRGGTPPLSKAIAIDLPATNKPPLTVLLAPLNDYAFLRRCLTAHALAYPPTQPLSVARNA